MLDVGGSLVSYLLALTNFELDKYAYTKKYPKVICD